MIKDARSFTRAHALATIICAPLVGLATRADAQSEFRVRIGTSTSDVNAGPFIAQDAGFFKKAGINAEITILPGAGAMAAAVAGGAIDVALTDSIVLANAANRGIPIVAIAGGGMYERGRSSTVFLSVAKDAPFKTARDFEGQKIGVVSLESLSGIAVRAWLAKNGADVGKVLFVEMPFATMVSALQRNSVAGAFLGEPYHSQAAADVRDITDAFGAMADRLCITEWITTRGWMQQNPDGAKRLVRAVYDCAKWANEHPDLTAPILVKYAKVDPEKIATMRRVRYATDFSPGLIQPEIDAGVKFKAIARATNAADLIMAV
jgi:NitT/TauT family transport system substrate-binding protein